MDYNAEFDKKFKQLNDEQRQAVEQINGPVMVVAGPGTGKTQLLSMRVANILRTTDTLPSNILCLTFTEAAATNMTERLSTIIGADAYKVEINTFHGFGSSIINRFSEYFYNGDEYQPADELTQGEIINDALAKLEYNNPLRSMNQGRFVRQPQLLSLIKDLKGAALSPDELRQIMNQNLEFCERIGDDVARVFDIRTSSKQRDSYLSLAQTAADIANSQPTLGFTNEPKLGQVFAMQLARAIDEATSGITFDTKPITSFKKDWLEKDSEKRYVLKDQKHSKLLLLSADIYEQYLAVMDKRGLYDFNDMIMGVIRAIESNPELKANLQEQYQYILVDEFQDTNDAQMRLLENLTDYDDCPNLMVVGDDDQAIYRFQGADISNIQQFAKQFGDNLVQINLKNNYRSGAEILFSAQQVSSGISDRLTNVDGSQKQLHCCANVDSDVRVIEATTIEHELSYVAESIRNQINAGEHPGEIAVISRTHKTLEKLVPYLNNLDIQASYEKQRDVFQSELVQLLIALARLVDGLSRGNNNAIRDNLPKVFASEAFGLSRNKFYGLCLTARGDIETWLNSLKTNPVTKQNFDWLTEMARRANSSSLNRILLELIGTTATTMTENSDDDETATTDSFEFKSPVFDYYFNYQNYHDNSYIYLGFLNDVTALIRRVSEYMPDKEPKLADFLYFVDQCETLGMPIYANSSLGDKNNVQLMSAHGSKGLEFKTVYIIDAESEQWGSKSRKGNRGLAYPTNLAIGIPVGDDDDERRRLYFVALTRAKQHLIITSHSVNEKSKETTALEYSLNVANRITLDEPDILNSIRQTELSLLADISQPTVDDKQLLAGRLQNYHLSATDLNTFTDVSKGGPTDFLLYKLLRVPTATNGSLVFGNAVHHTMQELHEQIALGRRPTIDEGMAIFERTFDKYALDLDEIEASTMRQRGVDNVRQYLEQNLATFNPNQHAEVKLNATLANGVRITGKLDCLEVDKEMRTVKIIDYKTGSPFADFEVNGNDYTKIKIRHYKQQLMFYKLLVEKSGNYDGFRVTGGSIAFIEADRSTSKRYQPELEYYDEEMAEFEQLITSVWSYITSLDLPDISEYNKDYHGIVDFEEWLCANPNPHLIQ